MGGGGKYRKLSKVPGRKTRRKKSSNYSGKAVNNEVFEAFGGLKAQVKANSDELFVIDKNENVDTLANKAQVAAAKVEEQYRANEKRKSEIKYNLRATKRQRQDVEEALNSSQDETKKHWLEKKRLDLLVKQTNAHDGKESQIVKRLIEQELDEDLVKQKKLKTAEKLAAIEKNIVAPVRNEDIVRKETEQVFATTEVYDLWGSKNEETVSKINERKSGKIDKRFAAVKVVHPGASFNPTKEDHLDSLKKVIDNEKEVIKATNPSESFYNLFHRINLPEPSAETNLLNDENENDENDMSDDSEGDDGDTKRNKKARKLTIAERNRQKRLRSEETAARNKKNAKRYESQFKSIEQVAKQVAKAERIRQKRKDLIDRERSLAAKNAQPVVRINGKEVVEGKLDSVEAILPSDFDASAGFGGQKLRHLAPHGNLLKDRFDYMQARNLFETQTLGAEKKQPRMKMYKRGNDFFPDDPIAINSKKKRKHKK